MQQAKLRASNQLSFQDSLLHKQVNDLTFVAFDTETTGRHPIISGLLEVSAIKFNAKGQVLESRTQLINPGRSIPEDVTLIHGITDEMVADAPSVKEVIPPFVDWMKAKPSAFTDESDMNVFIAHNASFDVNFLQVALTRLGMPLPANPVIDTLKMARHFVNDSRNHRLKTLVEYFKLDELEGYHRAEVDSRHVMRVFLSMLANLDPQLTLAELVDACGLMFFSKPFEEIQEHGNSGDLRVQTIGEAMQLSSDLYIHYRGPGIKFRQITPLSVLYSAKRYYLNAYCHAAKSERTFRVDRIASLELLDGKTSSLRLEDCKPELRGRG
ncbi:MAG: WYL domain-containing protein [Candidatus Obscuribacterales bacterium]|nr:WYL domain-containing protein [Candidatus Obscuribacterales bacterium]